MIGGGRGWLSEVLTPEQGASHLSTFHLGLTLFKGFKVTNKDTFEALLVIIAISFDCFSAEGAVMERVSMPTHCATFRMTAVTTQTNNHAAITFHVVHLKMAFVTGFKEVVTKLTGSETKVRLHHFPLDLPETTPWGL